MLLSLLLAFLEDSWCGPSRDIQHVGDPLQVPVLLLGLEVVDGILHSMLSSLRAFEAGAMKARCRAAIERRKLKPSLIFQDLAGPRAMPVQTVVQKRQAVVAEVLPHEAEVCLDRPVRWQDGPLVA